MATPKTKDLVVDCGLSEDTVVQLLELRSLRLQIVKGQLADINTTLCGMVDRGLIQLSEVATQREALRSELEHKKHELEERQRLYPNTVHSSELEIYLEML
jgi:cell shape-determining protein MreC